MRFTLISVALLALAYSVAPGVHGAPAVVSDRTNSLAVRQEVDAIVDNLLGQISSAVASVLGGQNAISPQLAEQILQDLQKSLSAAPSVLARALSSTSDPTSSAHLTASSPTTTSIGSVAASGQIGTSAVAGSNSPSVSLSTPPASSVPPARMRRQLPSSPLTSVLSVAGIITSSSPLQSVKSIPASALSKLGSATSETGTNQPTNRV